MILDERGARDVPVEQIARAAGISRPDVYRTVDSKEEIFVLVLTDYLAELTAWGPDAPERSDAATGFREACLRYLDFCIEYPAFVDCAWLLLQWPAVELREEVSESTWSRLGQALSAWLGGLERILAAGAKQGTFEVDDPAFTANRLGVQMLGSMQLARFDHTAREAARVAVATSEVRRRRSECRHRRSRARPCVAFRPRRLAAPLPHGRRDRLTKPCRVPTHNDRRPEAASLAG